MVELRLAPYPSISLQQKITPDEWALCVDSWLLSTEQYLLLPLATFETHLFDGSSLVEFLTSYVASKSAVEAVASAVSRRLRENTFLLIHRALTETKMLPSALLSWQFLSNLSVTFQKSKTLRNPLQVVWQRHQLGDAASMRSSKSDFMSLLEQKHSGSLLEDRIAQELAFSRTCYLFAQFLMVGSDMLDSLVSAYDRGAPPSSKTHLVALVYVCFTSLMNEHESRFSTLLDHLYSHQSTNIVKALIETTPFLSNFKNHISTHKEQSGRATPLVKILATFQQNFKAKRVQRSTIAKGKRKSTNTDAGDTLGGVHVHKLSLVTQIQDLFPDLGSGFIIKLLDEYKDNTEEITAHLLDDNLPLHLKQADRSDTFDFSHAPDLAPKLSPPSSPSPPPTRRNIYDDDDFDNLAVDASRLHLGRKNKDLTADSMLSSERSSNQKAAILSALAAFDSDDDERDDTYDAEDVGGTVDNTSADDGVDMKSDQNDSTLFDAYRMTPELFNRDWNTRRGQPRSVLKRETGMTDEAIEGWAIMLSRDPKRLKHLERMHDKRAISHQRPLEATSWREISKQEGRDDDIPDGQGSNRGGAEGSGQGGHRPISGRGDRGGRGRGGVTGPANERDTQVARQRKDANKSSRANHNRRDQRARKMARGGFPG